MLKVTLVPAPELDWLLGVVKVLVLQVLVLLSAHGSPFLLRQQGAR